MAPSLTGHGIQRASWIWPVGWVQRSLVGEERYAIFEEVLSEIADASGARGDT